MVTVLQKSQTLVPQLRTVRSSCFRTINWKSLTSCCLFFLLEYQMAYHRMTRLSMQGTVNWMAPECAKGKGGYSAKVDIWYVFSVSTSFYGIR
jgi:serine/threonine protein kinase